MAVTVSTVAKRYIDVAAGVPISSIPMPLFAVEEVVVYYGAEGLVAVQDTDYTVTLGGDFSTFTITPLASLIAKIDALILADPTEVNYILVRRSMGYTTEATSDLVRYTPFTARALERIAMQLMQLDERMNRAIQLGPQFAGDSADLVLEELQPGRALIADPTGLRIIPGPDATDIANAQPNAAAAAASAALAEAAETAAAASQVAAAASAAAAGAAALAQVQAVGLGVTLNTAVIANIDATNNPSGYTRFDGTTLGTFPAGVVKADGGRLFTDRRTSTSFGEEMYSVTTGKTYRREYEGSFGAWVQVLTNAVGNSDGVLRLLQEGSLPSALNFTTNPVPQNWAYACLQLYDVGINAIQSLTIRPADSGGVYGAQCNHKLFSNTTFTSVNNSSVINIPRANASDKVDGVIELWRDRAGAAYRFQGTYTMTLNDTEISIGRIERKTDVPNGATEGVRFQLNTTAALFDSGTYRVLYA